MNSTIDGANFPDYIEDSTVRTEEAVIVSSPLELPIEDRELVILLNNKLKEAEEYETEIRLPQRRKENYQFWLGEQLDKSRLHDWQSHYVDNVINQDLETRNAISAGRMPDVICTSPTDDSNAVQRAEDLEQALQAKMPPDMLKRMLKDALRHLQVEFIGAVKCRWDPNKGPYGDFLFELVHPSRLVVDGKATIPHNGFSSDNMTFVGEYLEESLALVVAKFPDKRDELFAAFSFKQGTVKQMATKVRYLEAWFTWYDDDGSQIEGVTWRYNDIILGKEKMPYYDWDGYDALALDEDGDPTKIKKYRNHFDRPRKPYMMMSYMNSGKGPYEDTTSVEQAIPLQKIVNKRGRQITEIADRAVGKTIVSGKAMTKEDAGRITSDPDEKIWVNEEVADVNQAIMITQGIAPSPVLLQDLQSNRAQMDSKFATHTTTRGEAGPDESGVSKQITREGDLSMQDDLADIAVERIVYEMANWAVQMMRYMYHKPHSIQNVGKDKKVTRLEMQRDKIDEGVAVNVQASTTDKQTRKADAMNLAMQKAIDPLSLFEALDFPNPREETQRLLLFLTGGIDGYARYMQFIGLDPSSPLSGQETMDNEDYTNLQINGDQNAIKDIKLLLKGGTPKPENIDEAYLNTMHKYLQSDSFNDEKPDIQQRFQAYIQQLQQLAQQQAQQTAPNAMTPPGQPPQASQQAGPPMPPGMSPPGAPTPQPAAMAAPQ